MSRLSEEILNEYSNISEEAKLFVSKDLFLEGDIVNQVNELLEDELLSPNVKLVIYMTIKAELISYFSYCEIDKTDYFCKTDKELLMGLNKDIAQEVWETLSDNIRHKDKFGISKHTCPFCILFKKIREHTVLNFYQRYKRKRKVCENCEYAVSHKICENTNSDLYRIQNLMSLKVLNQIFSNDNLKFFIEEIERVVKLSYIEDSYYFCHPEENIEKGLVAIWKEYKRNPSNNKLYLYCEEENVLLTFKAFGNLITIETFEQGYSEG